MGSGLTAGTTAALTAAEAASSVDHTGGICGGLVLQQVSSWDTEVPEPAALCVLPQEGVVGAQAVCSAVGAPVGGSFVVVAGRGVQLAATL
jgi:hypothetical protein